MVHTRFFYNNDDINILGPRVILKKTEALVAARKEIGLDVNANKTNYMAMYRDKNAGRNHNTKIDNSYFERVELFKYLGTT
jgi:hypothetical protein